MGPVLWSAALLLASQGVWNLAPVLATARLADAATLAAGFTTVAVVVRAPVLLFPTIQAMLLPRLAGGARTPRPLVAAVVAAGLVWVALATVAVPFVAALDLRHHHAPAVVGRGGAGAVHRARHGGADRPGPARGRPPHRTPPRWPGSPGWSRCSSVGLVAAPPVAAATIGQLAAAALVLGALVIAGRKP